MPGQRVSGLEVLEQLTAGSSGVAPIFVVRCRPCGRTYETKSFLRQIVVRKSCRPCRDAKRRRRNDAGKTRPADLPAFEHYASKPHGQRLRYLAGCRCAECREANNAYARLRGKLVRDGQGNPMIDAARARRHLARLSAAGVGRRTVADVAGVAQSIIAKIRAGRKMKIRRATERALLAVSIAAARGGTLVDAAPTWRHVAWLLSEGFTRGEIARRLGHKRAALQIGRARVTRATAAAVQRLWRAYQ